MSAFARTRCDLRKRARPAIRIRATVEEVQWQGDHHAITFDCAGTTLRLVTKPLRERLERGASVDLTFDPDDATLIGAGG